MTQPTSPAAPMPECYVYYRVKRSDAAALREAAYRLRADLARHTPGSRMRLLCRADETPVETGDAGGAGPLETQTWMEIHDRPGQGIDAAARRAIESMAARHLEGLIVGPRHLEVFVGTD